MVSQDEIRRVIQNAAEDGRVACKVLLDLAERTQTPPKEIGGLCDDMGFRIRTCQLGCFP